MLKGNQIISIVFFCLLHGLPPSLAGSVAHGRARRQKSVLHECQIDVNNVTFARLLDCVRDKSLLYLDTITTTNSIDLLGSGAVKLVRRNSSEVNHISEPISVIPNGLPSSSSPLKGVGGGNTAWAVEVVNKLGNLLQTHVLQIDVIGSSNRAPGVAEGRRRRNQMLPVMMFGITAIGMIIIPIGFQFLSLFAGKAVLLSKLALMLASINGLKRLANSGINYGFYTAPEAPPPFVPPYHHRQMWDRSEHPRNEK